MLVVDNGARVDESCVGDLVALEVQAAGLSGIVTWGVHRDTADIRAIGLPVFSLGSVPNGPLRLDPQPADALESASFGQWTITRDDIVLADDDGVVFIPSANADGLFARAEAIRDTERRQASNIRDGRSLRGQLGFEAFLARRAQEPSFSFRDHLRGVGGAIEE